LFLSVSVVFKIGLVAYMVRCAPKFTTWSSSLQIFAPKALGADFSCGAAKYPVVNFFMGVSRQYESSEGRRKEITGNRKYEI